uniref:Uncharacterized protein n=1 Tax=Oryza punctata TaxID=4537 RepID=A0A0E0JJE4_ORYPU
MARPFLDQGLFDQPGESAAVGKVQADDKEEEDAFEEDADDEAEDGDNTNRPKANKEELSRGYTPSPDHPRSPSATAASTSSLLRPQDLDGAKTLAAIARIANDFVPNGPADGVKLARAYFARHAYFARSSLSGEHSQRAFAKCCSLAFGECQRDYGGCCFIGEGSRGDIHPPGEGKQSITDTSTSEKMLIALRFEPADFDVGMPNLIFHPFATFRLYQLIAVQSRPPALILTITKIIFEQQRTPSTKI